MSGNVRKPRDSQGLVSREFFWCRRFDGGRTAFGIRHFGGVREARRLIEKLEQFIEWTYADHPEEATDDD